MDKRKKKKKPTRVQIDKNFFYVDRYIHSSDLTVRSCYYKHKFCPVGLGNKYIDKVISEKELQDALKERKKKREVSRIAQESAEKAIDPWILDKCAENIGFFASVFLEEHVTKRFGPFHHTILHDLHRLALPDKNKDNKDLTQSTSDNKHYVKLPPKSIKKTNNIQNLLRELENEDENKENTSKIGEGIKENAEKTGSYVEGGGDAVAPAIAHYSLDPQFLEKKSTILLKANKINHFVTILKNKDLKLTDIMLKEITQTLRSIGIGDVDAARHYSRDDLLEVSSRELSHLVSYVEKQSHAFSVSSGIGDHILCNVDSFPSDLGDIESNASIERVSKVPRNVKATRLEIEEMLRVEIDWEELDLEDRYAIATPRGHGKTTLVSFIFVMWLICFQLYKFIVLVSDSEDQAKLNLEAIRLELESNDRLRHVFGNLEGERIWGDLAMETRTGIRVQVRGAGQRIRGLKYRSTRPGMIVIDDLENDQNVETEDQRRKLKRWFYGALLPSRALDGKFAYSGTILHEASLLGEVLKKWPSRTFRIEEEGKVLWPDVYDMEKIDRMRGEYRDSGEIDVFYREYYNQIMSPGDAPFQRRYFRYVSMGELVDRGERGEEFKTFMTIDPAYVAEKGADYSAIVVCHTDIKNVMYISEVVRGRWDMFGLLNCVFEMVKKHHPSKVGMQKNDWRRVFKVPFLTEMRRRQEFFRIDSLQSYSPKIRGLQNKKNRIARLSPRYASGMMVHVKEGNGIHTLEQELLSFPRSRNDDCADALSMLIDLIFPASKPKEKRIFYDDPSDFESKISGYQ